MKERLVGFLEELRRAGVGASVSEGLDAAAAVALAGVERSVLREALAATLVKDHADRPVFDQVFDRYFAVPARERRKGLRSQPAEQGEGQGRGEGAGRGQGERPGEARGEARERRERRHGERQREPGPAQRLARRRALREMPFREMDPRQVEEVSDLVEDLGQRFRSRWARRIRRAQRGRLDMRRTIRRSMGRGGVPIELLLRRPRPGKSDLLALVDLSYSTETAARFLLALLTPARRFFRRATFFAFVDAIAEVSYENDHVVPHGPLDLNARSDFGRVLQALWQVHEPGITRNTVLLVLGDARNNRRPPRVDLLARLHREARAVVWLNPDAPERWNTGDSVIETYAREIDMLFPAHNLRTLASALAQVARHAA